MPQRSKTAPVLFFLAALVLFGNVIYKYTQGRGVEWYEVTAGVALVGAGVYFATVKRPT